jgi:hypothetical protein
MKKLVIAIALLAAGCGSPTLKVTVQRYDLDGVKCPTPNDKLCGRRAFAEARGPTPEVVQRELEGLRQALAAYGIRLKQLNRVTSTLMSQPGGQKDATVDKIVNAHLDATARAMNAVTFQQTSPNQNPQSLAQTTTAVFQKTFGLVAELRAANVVLPDDSGQIEQVLKQLDDKDNPTTKKLVADARKALAELPEPRVCRAPELPKAEPVLFRAWMPSFFASVAECQRTTTETAAELVTNGDADEVRRDHTLLQNMADPFLAFLASHPEAWSDPENLNKAEVGGDGDAEFVLVLEQGLDGRWKSVTVDPTKVIQARLKIGRSVAFAAAALAGTVAGGVGIPLPQSAGLGGSSDTDPNIAKVASETKWLELENEKTQAELARLESALVRIHAELRDADRTKPNYANVRAQLQRLIANFSMETSTESASSNP